MASEVIAFPVNLRKNKNQYSSSYGKYFPEVDSKESLNLKGFAKHLAEHGKLVDYPMAVLVLQNIVACLKEMVIQGQPVKLDGFGTFAPTIETADRKAQDTVEQSLALGLENLIGGVHLRFVPENSKGEKLTSRALKEECTFKAAYVVESKKKVVDGKERTYQEKIPISSFAVATASSGTGE